MELALQKILEATVGSEPMMHALASAAYQSFLRAYAAHSKAEKRVRAAPLSTPESGWHNTSNLGVLSALALSFQDQLPSPKSHPSRISYPAQVVSRCQARSGCAAHRLSVGGRPLDAPVRPAVIRSVTYASFLLGTRAPVAASLAHFTPSMRAHWHCGLILQLVAPRPTPAGRFRCSTSPCCTSATSPRPSR